MGQQLESVEKRHVYVKNKEIGLGRAQRYQGRLSIFSGHGLKSGYGQCVAEQITDPLFVIDHKDEGLICFSHVLKGTGAWEPMWKELSS